MIKFPPLLASIARGSGRKAWAALFVIVALTAGICCIDYDCPVDEQQLPERARTFLHTHFPGQTIAFAEKEVEVLTVTYKVILVNGTKLVFARNGDWLKIDSKFGHVPPATVPAPIRSWLDERALSGRMLEIEKEHGTYEVKLSEGIEMKFDDATFEIVSYEH